MNIEFYEDGIPVIPTSELISFLAKFSEVDDELRDRFKAQVNAMLRAGLPVVARPGRGRQALWNPNDILMLCSAIELWRVGVAPSRTVYLISNNWQNMRHDLFNCGRDYLESHAKGINKINSSNRHYWKIKLDGISIYQRSDRPHLEGKYDTVEHILGEQLVDHLNDTDYLDRRYLLIDVDRLITDFMQYAGQKLYSRGQLPVIIESLGRPWSLPKDSLELGENNSE